MSNPARRLATYEDLLVLGPEVRAEVIDGEVVTSPSPSPLHQGAIGGVHAELRSPFQRGRGGPGGWWLTFDVDVFFGPHDILRPDIAAWRQERVPTYPTERPLRITPDWVCEALSPTTAARDQGDKRIIYQRANVPWYWIVDPIHRSLQVYRLTPDGYLLDTSVGDRGVARLHPFDAVQLELDALFPEVGTTNA